MRTERPDASTPSRPPPAHRPVPGGRRPASPMRRTVPRPRPPRPDRTRPGAGRPRCRAAPAQPAAPALAPSPCCLGAGARAHRHGVGPLPRRHGGHHHHRRHRGRRDGGDQNILLVGVDSRTDAQGRPLPPEVLRQLHSGPDTGVLNSDTIILLHVPEGGGAAIAFSIPRDAYVDIPGYRRDKINAAYPANKALAAERLVGRRASRTRAGSRPSPPRRAGRR